MTRRRLFAPSELAHCSVVCATLNEALTGAQDQTELHYPREQPYREHITRIATYMAAAAVALEALPSTPSGRPPPQWLDSLV
mmetsp:Transcript_8482/g.25473  ORF Transcript_8482/g.25473 Transcript_8482/m.25473 type:complete len:82 (-) Transcript_8482:761-1006(-)